MRYHSLGAFGFEDPKPPTEGNILATTRSHSNKTVVDSIDACEPTEVVRVGGAGHKVSMSSPLRHNLSLMCYLTRGVFCQYLYREYKILEMLSSCGLVFRIRDL